MQKMSKMVDYEWSSDDMNGTKRPVTRYQRW